MISWPWLLYKYRTLLQVKSWKNQIQIYASGFFWEHLHFARQEQLKEAEVHKCCHAHFRVTRAIWVSYAYSNLTNLVQGSKLKGQAWNIHLCVVWSKTNIPGSGRFFQMIAVDNTARLMTESGMPRGGNDQFLASLCCQLARFRSSGWFPWGSLRLSPRFWQPHPISCASECLQGFFSILSKDWWIRP